MPTVLTIHNDARTLLNDTFSDIFTDAILLPFTKKAYQELQDELTLNGIETTIETDFTANIASGTNTKITNPSDFIAPLEVWEKPQGNPDTDYVLMSEKSWEPDIIVTDTLRFWQWNDDEVRFPGANTNRTVKVKYIKFLTAIVDTTTNIPVINCQLYLAARVAAIAAFAVGGNPDRSEVYQSDANARIGKVIQIAVKRNQQLGTRRQPNRSFS